LTRRDLHYRSPSQALRDTPRMREEVRELLDAAIDSGGTDVRPLWGALTRLRGKISHRVVQLSAALAVLEAFLNDHPSLRQTVRNWARKSMEDKPRRANFRGSVDFESSFEFARQVHERPVDPEQGRLADDTPPIPEPTDEPEVDLGAILRKAKEKGKEQQGELFD